MEENKIQFRYHTKEQYEEDYEYLAARIHTDQDKLEELFNVLEERKKIIDQGKNADIKRFKLLCTGTLLELILAIVIIISLLGIPAMVTPALIIFGIVQPLVFCYGYKLLWNTSFNKQDEYYILGTKELLEDIMIKVEVHEVLRQKLKELIIEMNEFSIVQNENLEYDNKILKTIDEKDKALVRKYGCTK